ncbi:hypothetical protein DUI87_23729 [Hirundo rustica rustica]|uniref:ribonuclease H n=1 Tax=Hirundo rustica rustica TaxID=333673 RepID=A0A3M0JF34_HIRRU|nr:hypothetical protein DUI87_23729 [Hirundo rustica rustica]
MEWEEGETEEMQLEAQRSSSLLKKSNIWHLTCSLKPQKVPKNLEEPLGEHVAEESHTATQPNKSFQPYSKIEQLPSEPLVTFVERLTQAIELQVKNEGAQEQVLEEMALADANGQCKAAVLSLSIELASPLHEVYMLQVCARKIPFIKAHQNHSSRVKLPQKAAALDAVPPVPVPQPLPKRVSLVVYKGSRGGHNVRAVHHPFSQATIRDLCKAHRDYGRDSPYFRGLLRSDLEAAVVIPADLRQLFSCLLDSTELKLWEAAWRQLLREALPSLLTDPETAIDENGNALTLEHLMGEGRWTDPTDQASGSPIKALMVIREHAVTAFFGMVPDGPVIPYYKIIQGTKEAFTKLVERLTRAIEVQKLKALEELVEKHLQKGHIVETDSPWNSPVFVIQKLGKDKWRLLQDLRQINNVIEDMGSLQPGMPSPAMLPENWKLAIIDIKDWFFQIPLHPDDAPRFAFSVPTINREAPRKLYHWRVLPQGMKNSPVICQWYVASLLSPVRTAAGQAIIHHYMDDVLVCAPTDDVLTHALDLTINALIAAGFELQEEKVQRMPPWKYLGLEIGKRTIVPQKLAIKTKALGELAHLECWVVKQANLTTNALANLLDEEEITRQATLQNRVAIDYLLLLHGHRCEEFEGLCCFNLSSKAEDVHTAIRQMGEMVTNIKRETDDWLSGLFTNWGISGWVSSIIKTVLLCLFVLLLIMLAFGLLKRMLYNLISATTHSPLINHVIVPTEESPEEEGLELEEVLEGAPEDDGRDPDEEEHGLGYPTQHH